MDVSLKYGNSSLSLRMPASLADVRLLEPGRTTPNGDEAALIHSALAHPFGSPTLCNMVSTGQRVSIVTSDITRPCPSARLLPPVLDELNRGGVRDEHISVVFGLGSHRPHRKAEQMGLVGKEILRRVRCVDSDPADVECIGHTRRGTPVAVFRAVLEADLRLCLGGIDYHYFAGYSGGLKAIMPGVCGTNTIQHNHRMMTEPGAVAARIVGNPVREDMEEAGEMVGVHFILNVILDEAKRVVRAVAGHPRAAHRQGCAQLDAFGRATLEEYVDLVVVSAGGCPKDINLYQAQKALDNACRIVRPGGIILLVAECREGFGNRTFEDWMQDPGGPNAIIAHIRREFVLGGHKAAAVAMAMQQASIYLVSALSCDCVRSIGFHPFESAQEALESALQRVGHNARVVVMPEGGSILPVVAPTS
jgi:nickel-dependent lactate racemase